MEFARTCVGDGVPVFWTESGDGMMAGLVFRVGRADEVLARGGITHLIEHLALHSLGADTRVHYNGQVDGVTTTFLTRGSPEEVAGFFQAVCAGLRELPIERLASERQVLRTEADSRRPAMTDPLFIERYGAETYGLVAYPEFGISAFQPDDLRAWAERYFTRGNAALWIAGGPPPSGLHLDLPDGPAMPAPKPAPGGPPTPAYVNAPVQGMSWSGLVRRSASAQVYAGVLNRKLLQELRHKRGLSYSPAVSYAIRDGEMAHVLAAADGLEEVHSQLVQAFFGALEQLEAGAVTEDEIRGTADALRAAADAPRGAAGYVQGAARAAIMGRPVRSATSLMEDLAAVSVADVHEVGREAFASSLFALPPKNQPYRPRVTQLGRSPGAAVAGRRIRSADHPLDQARLVIGQEGVSLVRGHAVDTVRYAQCAALLKWPDGARQLIGRDAVTIRIEPTLWRMKNHGAQLDDMVTADRSAYLPIRSDETVPRPWTRRQTRMAGRMLVNPSMAFLAGTVPVAALVALVAMFAPGGWGLAAVVLAVPGLGLGASTARIARARLLTRAAGRNARRR